MIGSIKRLVKLTGAHSQQFIRSIFYAILSVLLSFVPFYCIYKVVILLSQHSTNVNKVLIYGGISIVSIVLRYVFFGLSTVISHKAAYQILYDLRLRIANKLTRVSLGYFTSSHSGDIKKIMVDDVEKLEQFLAHNVPEVTSNVASLILLTIYLFVLDWRMALATLAVVPISMIAMRVMMIGQEEKMSKFHYAMSNMNTNIVEYIRGMHVIKVFNNSINSFGKYRNSVNDYNTHVLNWYKSCWPYMAIYFVVLGSSIMFVLPIGSYLYINGLLSLSKLILFLIICFVFTTPLVKLFDFSEGMQIIAENERCISELLSMEELSSSNNQVQINDYSVTLSNVSFGYTDQMVLKNVNMHAKQGEMTALVGPSGGGKSTIAKLIPRFWDIQKGEIQIGNAPIKQLPIEQLLDSILASIPFGILYFALKHLVEYTITMPLIIKYGVLLGMSVLIRILLNYGIYVLQSAAGYEIMRDKRIEIGDHLRKMSMGYFTEDTTGDLLATLTTELSFVEMYCMSLLSKIVGGITLTFVSFLVLLIVDWRLALIAVSTYPIAYYFYNKTVKSFKKLGNKRQSAQTQLIASVMEYVQGIHIIKAFNTVGIMFDKLKHTLKDHQDKFLRYEMDAAPSVVLFQGLIRLGSGLILLCGSYFVLTGIMNFNAFLLFLVISLKFYEPIEVLSVNYGILKIMDVSLDKIQGIIDEDELSEPIRDKQPNDYTIQFKNVDFSYQEKATLRNINLTIPRNKMTAIVGPSGFKREK